MDKLVERLLAWSETPFEGDPIVDALLSDVPEAGRRIQALEAELADMRAALPAYDAARAKRSTRQRD